VLSVAVSPASAYMAAGLRRGHDVGERFRRVTDIHLLISVHMCECSCGGSSVVSLMLLI